MGLFGTSAAMSMFDLAPNKGTSGDGPGDDLQKKEFTASAHEISGTQNADTFYLSGTATGYGGKGADTIDVTDSAVAYGENGFDTMVADKASIIYGGNGADSLTAYENARAYGGDNGDVMFSDAFASSHRGAGDDTITALGQSWGDDGDDQFSIDLGGNAAVAVFGGAGDDTIVGSGGGASTVYGGLGDDLIDSEGFLAMGDAGNDTIVNAFSGGGGADSVFGGDGNDSLSGDTTHYGGEGDDTIFAEMGCGYGDGGNDRVAAQYAYGGAGDDMLRLLPFSGEGYVSGSEAYGGDGDDTLRGALDYIYDMGAAKILSGGAGNDLIYAKGGEQVDAGAGNDTVFAFTASYAETTNMTLGDGADNLVMTLAPASGDDTGDEMGSVTVQDFNPATDHLALIVAPSNVAGLQYSITPNLAGGNTEVTFTLLGASVIYDFQGLTSLNASAIKLYADEAAVAAGVSYRTLS